VWNGLWKRKTKVEVSGWVDLPFWKSDLWKNIDKLLSTIDFNPGPENLFRALIETPLHEVKVVILGQDPYPDSRAANGLAFSIKDDYRLTYPPTLRRIFEELCSDVKCNYPKSGDLSPWAQQGVLLLNSVLTCRPGDPGSHRSLGWQVLTHQILEAVLVKNPKAIFVLWGKEAESTASGLKHNCVKSNHPSPLAAAAKTGTPFLGSRPFTRVNALLTNTKQKEIDWRL
jgi:uracil-DNA glycosylase